MKIKFAVFCFVFFMCWWWVEPTTFTAIRKGWYGEALPHNVEKLVGEWTIGPCPRTPRLRDRKRIEYTEDQKLYRCTTDRAVMVYVSPGEFVQGSRKSSNSDSLKQRKVNLSGYYIDRYEVSNSQFTRFRKQNYGVERYWSSEGLFWFRQKGTRSLRQRPPHPADIYKPAVKICWYEAETYASSFDKKLPTEAQWEKAARGTTGRDFPWGNIKNFSEFCHWYIGPRKASLLIEDTKEAKRLYKNKEVLVRMNQPFEDELKSLAVVGTYPSGNSPYGCFDMAGNAAEWVRDAYDINYYDDAPSRDPFNGKRGTLRVTRGGSWSSPKEHHLTSYYRIPREPYKKSEDVGFRTVVEAPKTFSIEDK